MINANAAPDLNSANTPPESDADDPMKVLTSMPSSFEEFRRSQKVELPKLTYNEPEPEPEPELEPDPEPDPEPTPDSDLGPNPQESISNVDAYFKSIEKVTPEAKDRILDAVIRRDEASRRRLDAVPEGLPLEEQDEILDKEIAIEKADRELMEDLASDDGTVGSMERKLGKSLQAVADATEIKPEKAPEPGSDEFEETLKNLNL